MSPLPTLCEGAIEMRKRHVEPKARMGKSEPAQRRPRPVAPKRSGSGRSGRAIDECRTYV